MAKPVQPFVAQLLRRAEKALMQGDRLVAMQCWQQVHQSRPKDLTSGLRLNLLILLLEQEQLPAALGLLAFFSAAGEVDSQAYNALGVYYQKKDQLQAAEAAWEEAVRRFPGNADAWSNLAYAQNNQLKMQSALASMEKALSLRPDRPDYLYNKGRVLQELKQYDAALGCYAQALRLQPDFYLCYNNSANIYYERREWAVAETFVQKAKQLRPEGEYLEGASVLNCLSLVRWSGYFSQSQAVRAAISQGRRAAIPLALLMLPLNVEEQNAGAALWMDDQYPDRRAPGQRLRRPGRWRVAYVSSDFCHHAVSILMRGLFARHDRLAFEVFLYSTMQRPGDILQQQMQAEAEHFIDVSGLDDAAVLALALEHDIDIAVDLNGHTQGARTRLFSRGLAPVQVHYLGFPGGMGAACYDYVLADPIIVPPEHQASYREKIVYLPGCFQVNDDQRELPASMTRAQLGWPEDAFIFACHNNTSKLNPVMFNGWMAILRACPEAMLTLLGEVPEVVVNLRQAATDCGVDPQRLLLAGRLTYSAHLGRLAAADLVLDTLPFNGGTSTSDALWAGVPVLTCTGDTFAGRMSTSLLHRVGLTELICSSLEQYAAMAVALYSNRELLGVLRRRLAVPERRHCLFATDPATRAIERAYVRMQQRYAAGLSPESFSVD